jgi:hypothetical protein
MATTTRERNYRKNPHTATFLRVFHSGIGTDGRNYREEMAMDDDAQALALEASEDDDLLNLVPTEKVQDDRTPGQVRFMDSLIRQITELDPATGQAAREWTDKATAAGDYWTPQRGGTASTWIDKMLAKLDELKKATLAAPVATPAAEIPAGTYAVETDEVRCYTVDYGKAGTRWAGFLFLNRISSDDRFPVKNPAAKAEILAAIGRDVEASAILAALTLRRCRRCGRQLSDTKNPYFGQGLGPDCGAK